MMADTDDKAQQALSITELDAASKLGLEVTTCRICKRPTLWMKGSLKLEWMTCGRSVCLDKWAEELGK